MNLDRQLAKKLKEKFKTANTVRIRTGVVVSVSGSTATVTIGGDDIPGIPVYASVTGLTAGSKVDIHYDGDCPRVVGKTA